MVSGGSSSGFEDVRTGPGDLPRWIDNIVGNPHCAGDTDATIDLKKTIYSEKPGRIWVKGNIRKLSNGKYTYEAGGGQGRTNGFASALCVESDGNDLVSSDFSTPASGSAFFYLVAAKNSCGPGTLGEDGSYNERVGRSCP